MAGAGNSHKVNKKLNQNKIHYDSTVSVGKSLYGLVLQNVDPRNISFKEKLGMSRSELKKKFNVDELAKLDQDITLDNLEELDVSLIHKLVRFLCALEEKDADLEQNLRYLKDCRNCIAHSPGITLFTDFYVWPKMMELRALFTEILNRINKLFSIDVSDQKREIKKKVDNILKEFEVEVRESQFEDFMNRLNSGVKCPLNEKVEIKGNPRDCSNLGELVDRMGKENTRIKLHLNKLYYDVTELESYDSREHILPLLDSSTCQ
ncbi:unnamed protein product, partial [Meganyctiphanes norvegica]